MKFKSSVLRSPPPLVRGVRFGQRGRDGRPGPELACYHSAKAGETSNLAIKDCTEALKNSELSPRDRAATYTNRSACW